MSRYEHIWAKGESVYDGGAEPLSLVEHLQQVAFFTRILAGELGLDGEIAVAGALMHDIGKTSTRFQPRLRRGYKVPRHIGGDSIFRHEIASLFFLSLVPAAWRPAVIEMVAGHHKSVKKDVRDLGLIDLDDNEKSFEIHSRDFDQWRDDALGILREAGFAGLIPGQTVTLAQARESYDQAVAYCRACVRVGEWSEWKGVLTAADTMASALAEQGLFRPDGSGLFRVPDLSYYASRRHELYPLSQMGAGDPRPHTLVTAPTGAGKTDFLLRRCQGRVFYTLPFQASINAMYDRIRNDLASTGADVRLLHACSALKSGVGGLEERILQRHVGASVKVMTPHQMASVAFGVKGYEAMLADLKGCDVILDEIHTYSDTMQAIVLKIVEILAAEGCRVHVGTATMPKGLYDRILALLGGAEYVYEVKLDVEQLDTFDRHIVHKLSAPELVDRVIDEAVRRGDKVLVVCNQVARAQEAYGRWAECYGVDSVSNPVPVMLIHSRFKRGDRARLERQLLEMDRGERGGVVISTQVVEVSLDISFDLMVTECAPLDALVQRFGRINRRRTPLTIGHYKPVYVIAPPDGTAKQAALPYSLDVLQRSYDLLPDGALFRERDMQGRLDALYAAVAAEGTEETGAADGAAGATGVELGLLSAYGDGRWRIGKLMHRAKSALLEALDIDSVACVTEEDAETYRTARADRRLEMEIPVSYNAVGRNGLHQLREGSAPYVIPARAYSAELGFLREFATPEYEDVTNRFL